MELALLTPELPGTGGELKRNPDDFVVEEVPLYLPSGEGDHVFVLVRKRGIATFEAVRRIAQALGLPERRISYAGMKDARAVTTQWLSVFGAGEEAVRAVKAPRIEILEVCRHTNRLKIGHLRGNRFRIVVRDTVPGALGRAEAIAEVLLRRGAPNYFGEQRFGVRGATHRYGEAILRRDWAGFVERLLGGEPGGERDPRKAEARRLFNEGRVKEAYEAMPRTHRAEKKCLHTLLRFGDPERACAAVPKRMRQMYVSAYQSFLFNRIASARVPRLDVLEEGDLALLHRTTRIFPVQDAAAEQPRCAAFEISPTAPIFGTRVPLASGAPGAIERRVLEEAALEPDAFAAGPGLAFRGQRRSVRIPIREFSVAPVDSTALRFEFVLPSGCFATCVLREIMKPEGGGPQGA